MVLMAPPCTLLHPALPAKWLNAVWEACRWTRLDSTELLSITKASPDINEMTVSSELKSDKAKKNFHLLKKLLSFRRMRINIGKAHFSVWTALTLR